MILSNFTIIISSLILLELFIITILDLKTKKISNKFFLFNIGTFIVLCFFDLSFLSNISYFILLLILGLGFYWVKWVGAGDVKLFSGIILLIPPTLVGHFLSFCVIATGIFCLSMTVLSLFTENKNTLKHFFNLPWEEAIKFYKISKAPFAGVFFLAWIATFLEMMSLKLFF